jgi:hypothetical protein
MILRTDKKRIAIIYPKSLDLNQKNGATLRVDSVVAIVSEYGDVALFPNSLVGLWQCLSFKANITIGVFWRSAPALVVMRLTKTKIWFDACDSHIALRKNLRSRGVKNALAKYRDSKCIFFLGTVFRTYISENDAGLDSQLWNNGKSVVLPNLFLSTIDVNNNEVERVVFVGPISYEPNREAVEYIVDVFSVLLHKHSPNLQIYLYGSGTEKYRSINVNGIGYVEDENQIYGKHDLHIAPMISSSGVLNKVFIPLALGLRVVTTRLATNGINQSSNLFVSEDIEEFFGKFLEARNSRIRPISTAITDGIPTKVREFMKLTLDEG